MTEEFYIGQIFYGTYPEGAAEWCNNQENPYITIEEIEPQNGERVFKIVDITPTTEELVKSREDAFNKQFFNTSLGYIRRKVTMANGATKDFLSDLLPAIDMGVNSGKTIPIITYNQPDFNQDLTKEYMLTLQNRVDATAQFVQECFMQLSNDFTGV